MEFTITAAALAAVLPFVSTEETRPTLNGFLCRADGVLVATNGHILGMRRAAHTATVDIIIRPNAELKRLVKTAAGKRAPSRRYLSSDAAGVTTPVLTVVADPVQVRGEYVEVVVSYFGVSVRCEVADGPYPFVSQVFPRMDSAEANPVAGGIALNPKLLAAFGEYAHLAFVGPSRAIIVRTRDEDFAGLIMPMRMFDAVKPDVPAWVAKDETAAIATPAAA